MRAKLPPGPPYPSAVQAVGFWTRPLAFIEQCRERYGKRFTIRLPMTPPFVMLSDPADIKAVFTSPPDVLHPGEGAKVLAPIVGANSVILLDERSHLEQRKLMLPAFHGEKMAALEGLVTEVAEREVESWPRDQALSLAPRTQRLAMEIILRAVFGLDPGRRLDLLRDRLSAMLAFGDNPMSLLPPPGKLTAPIFERVGSYASFLRVQRDADELIFELIEERRGERADRDDILSMLLEARHEDGSPMSRQELRDELMTLLVAGHETTASTLAWTFERVIRQPEVHARLCEEVLADGDDAYLVATIQEALRRRPVLPNNAPRLVMREVEIGGWTYPQGASLVNNAYLVHHDPEIYPDPYAFRPERFLEQSPGTYTWIPFGGGRRRCLGASFAMLELRIVLKAVLRTHSVQPAQPSPEHAKRRNITVTPEAGSRVRLGSPARRPAPAAA